ncbi:MAG: hypothetical protein M3437_00925 [Chloroflexota bacterium]|nr:hypothetical protein [Chloroflexota bacterium]MDQ5867288.1 hypothetical protein [Chloroflexota bacterium]
MKDEISHSVRNDKVATLVLMFDNVVLEMAYSHSSLLNGLRGLHDLHSCALITGQYRTCEDVEV